MTKILKRLKQAKLRQLEQENSDALGLSMLSLTGFQIYHMTQKKGCGYGLFKNGEIKVSGPKV